MLNRFRLAVSRHIFAVSFLCLAVILTLATGFFVKQYSNTASSRDAMSSSHSSTDNIIEKVGQLYQLPENETPTVIQIRDRSQLTGQDFYKNAKNEDYILVYEEAKIALIYRKSIGKLINVGPIAFDSINEAGSQQ